MTSGSEFAEVVRGWVIQIHPSEEMLAERAVLVASKARAEGATTSQAFDVARTFVGCWERHPSRGKASQHEVGLVAWAQRSHSGE